MKPCANLVQPECLCKLVQTQTRHGFCANLCKDFGLHWRVAGLWCVQTIAGKVKGSVQEHNRLLAIVLRPSAALVAGAKN